MTGKDLEIHWIHGLIAIILSLSLLVAVPHMPFRMGVMELTTRILSIPEYPSVLLRNSIHNVSLWFEDEMELEMELESLRLENIRLKGILGTEKAQTLIRSMDEQTSRARITFRSPSSWWAEVRINRGKKDGMSVGLPVLQNGFVVGRVAGVENSSSWVELITSSSMMIPVVVDETRELGVIVGDGLGKTWLLYLPESSEVARGMTISTALVSEMLPPGLPIGRLDTSLSKRIAGTKAFYVQLGGDLSRLFDVDIYNPQEAFSQ